MSETKAAASPVARDLPCPIGDHPRRDLAVLLDMIWAALCGLIVLIISVVVQESLATRAGSDISWKVTGLHGLAIAVAAMLAASFTNQVLLTVWTRASLGKHATLLRVVRVDTTARPRFPQTVRRWLYGLAYVIAVLPLAALQVTDIGGPDGPRHDAMGLRTVRRTCLKLRGQCPDCKWNHSRRRGARIPVQR
ncbi:MULTISPECIES: RDD family protein [unclassified Streptomyces]|uniref:RDD family protein n=1 Tax=unclassified Streptomyces TaxID=2593676 RepID=UPI003824828E